MMPFLTPADIAAILWFFGLWVGYSQIADSERLRHKSVMGVIQEHRIRWMREMLNRDMRMVDTMILNHLQGGIGPFASISILAVGGLVPALLYSGCLSQGLLLPYFLPCAPYGRYRSMGVVLLFVISSGYWLSTRWDRKTRRNNLGGALSPSSTGRDQRGERTHLVLRPHGDIFRLRGSSQVSLWVAPFLLFRGGFRRPPQRRRHRGSTGTRCHPSRCGAGPRQVGGPAQLSPAPSRDASPLAWPTP